MFLKKQRILLAIFELGYTLLWLVALPGLVWSKRLRQGWWQRLGFGPWPQSDIWIQGASGGECTLAQTLVVHPDFAHLQTSKPLCVLLTSCTAQGLDIARATVPTQKICLCTCFFPFDLPWLMRRVLRLVRPKIVVLLETEIWPGLLLACKQAGLPVVILNARMTTTSLAGYLALGPVLRTLAPAQISAITTDDANRFDLIFGTKNTQVSANIKFDRAVNLPVLQRQENPLAQIIPAKALFVVLGSVRQEEEAQIFELIRALLHLRPDCIIGLFPRHLHRGPVWEDTLQAAGISVQKRSSLQTPVLPGTVILGDKFGELTLGYALAHRAFVGGSLARLGGQNFLEPLAQGVLPVIGPHWGNFAWVGQEIFTDLVARSDDPKQIASMLIAKTLPRAQVRAKFQTYVQARQGATRTSLKFLAPYFKDELCAK